MAKGALATEFRRNQKVRTLDDLPGVPRGTQGRVDGVGGFSWIRYRVAFDNGVDLGYINAGHLALAKQYDAALRERERAAARAAEVEVAEAAGNGAAEAEAAAGEGGGEKAVNGVTVPSHLLDRSAQARARLSG